MTGEREQGMEEYHKYQWSESHEIMKNSRWTKELILSSQWELGRERTNNKRLDIDYRYWSIFVSNEKKLNSFYEVRADIKWELKPSGRNMGDYRENQAV